MDDVVLSSNNTRGKAEFAVALELAAEVLGNSSECHRSIVIFTDGDTETLVQREVEEFSSRLEEEEGGEVRGGRGGGRGGGREGGREEG